MVRIYHLLAAILAIHLSEGKLRGKSIKFKYEDTERNVEQDTFRRQLMGNMNTGPTCEISQCATNQDCADGFECVSMCCAVISTLAPSGSPTVAPSSIPSMSPTKTKSQSPTSVFSTAPSNLSTLLPSNVPSHLPSVLRSNQPSHSPTLIHSSAPSASRSSMPTVKPSQTPTNFFSTAPSSVASHQPSNIHSTSPSLIQSETPSNNPSLIPSSPPSYSSDVPSIQPSQPPSQMASSHPSNTMSNTPSISVSESPSTSPSHSPTIHSSEFPSRTPSKFPSVSPSKESSNAPSSSPSEFPSSKPSSSIPEEVPSILPNWDFEQDTISPWSGNGGKIEKSSLHAHSGSYGGLITERTATWQGVSQSVLGQVIPDVPYFVSLWAKLVDVPDGTTANFYVTIYEQRQLDPNTVDRRWPKPIYTQGQLTNQWKYFSGEYTLTNHESITVLNLFTEGPASQYSYAVDDVIFRPLGTPSPTDVPSDVPTRTPAPSVTFEPSSWPTKSPAPTAPTSTPSSSPTEAPTPEPTVLDYFVSANSNTERVVIPSPPLPQSPTRINCPTDNGSLVDWTTQYPNLVQGQDVVIPDNTAIVIRSTVLTELGLLTIPQTSSLVFAENIDGINLDVTGIKVEGSMIAGAESCKYETPLTITLHGSRPDGITQIANRQDPSYKGISVTGRIDFHGKRYYRTWTRLAQRAHVGDMYLYLQDAVNWEPGQEIILVTTATRDSRDWHQNEVLTIASLQTTSLPHPSVVTVVHLTSPVQFDHIARPEYQGEVGLLTRTIKIQGAADDSPPTDVSSSTCQLTDHNGQSRSAYGYSQIQCSDTYLTGFGGHIMVHGNGLGYVEGVELFRMGQTNVLGRYPMHFHLLQDNCPGCYLKDSSIHESYYRCISVHNTNGITVSENVAFDITGFCYYLEDGVEEGNTLSYNLASHIHVIGSPAIGGGQQINPVDQSDVLTLPADVTASGFYITNLNNTVIGNVASGGWAGFAFPILQEPVGPSRSNYPGYNPSLQPAYLIDGNTAHSTAHFWSSAAAFYFGGSLYHLEDGTFQYNAGRDQTLGARRNEHWNRLTNCKVYQVANVGIGSWSGRMEVLSYEVHDTGLAAEALVAGFWMNDMVVACRTGETLSLPVQRADYIRGNGFFWYDTGQEHIITNSTFRNCGYRSEEYNQYDTSPTRGCERHIKNGCSSDSTVFGFLTHSDQFNPEIMQGTRNLVLDDVGRRFKFTYSEEFESVSGRTQNWYDVDGTATGLLEPIYMGSGLPSAGRWWNVDDDVILDPQGPLVFIQKNNGPSRGLAHIHLEWDDALHATTGISACFNGGPEAGIEKGCPAVGRIRHRGSRFNSTNDPLGGLPVTANADVAGLAGGYGWLLELDGGSPRELNISQVELLPHTPLLFSVPYPSGTSFTIKAKAASYCWSTCDRKCEEEFLQVDTVDAVFHSQGNVYHFDDVTGLLTIRITPVPSRYTSYGPWKLYGLDDRDVETNEYILPRFERDGVYLPRPHYGSMINIVADCATNNGIYCSESPPTTGVDGYDDVCNSPNYEQVSFDKCCLVGDPSICEDSLYPTTPSPTASPTISPDIFTGGDFEGDKLCPWYGSSSDLTLVTDDKYEGNQAVLVSNRQYTWAGLNIVVTEKFEFDVTYNFHAALKIRNGAVSNTFKVTCKVAYENGGSTQYFGVYSNNNFPTDTWVIADTSFTLRSSSLNPYPVKAVTIYFETVGTTTDYLVDDVSMKEEIGGTTII